MIQNLVICHLKLFLKLLFLGNNIFIFVHTFQWKSLVFLFQIFLVESLKPTKTSKKRSLILQYSFTQKISLSLQTSTHLRLKIIYSQNIAKNLSHFINFPASMFMFGIKIYIYIYIYIYICTA